jgi:murein DD-endopeptidase MepM/ murein hydrolase activator NlpD
VNTDSTRPSAVSAAQAQASGPAQRSFAAPAAGDREKIAELAREFESFFLLQMVRQMRQSMLDDEDGQGLGAGTMTDTMDVELGRQLAASGGIGLAPILQTALERQVGARTGTETATDGAAPETGHVAAFQGVGTSSPPAREGRFGAASAKPPAGSRQAADSAEEVAVPLPVRAPLSSHFGWRSDPFDGAARFHRGVDIAAAYGREVPAAGSGQVLFAGEDGGYGNTVVIEHADGVRTRYAHLSSLQVAAGQQVSGGATIGRVGTTGRSTGPHLHFEVLQDGRPVDPERAATRYAGQLKFGGVVAD